MPLIAFLLAAQAATVTRVAPPTTGRIYPVCTGVRVTAPDRALPPKDMTFSSREVLDLALRPRLRQNLEGEHVMRLRLMTPGGFLYQVITLPFVGAAADGGERPGWTTNREGGGDADPLPTRAVPGYPHPLAVQRLVPASGGDARGGYELHARLPVAGTSITLSSLYGTWSVRTYLDGQEEPCGPETRFTIRD